MTDVVNPSSERLADSFLTSGAIAYGGGTEGFIVDASVGDGFTDLARDVADIDENELDSFDDVTEDDGLNRDIAPGEGFVFGSYIARDVETTVTLDDDTEGQTVYVGWDGEGGDSVIIGLEDAFTWKDQRIPLITYDTSSDEVSSSTEEASKSAPGETSIASQWEEDEDDENKLVLIDPYTGIIVGTSTVEEWMGNAVYEDETELPEDAPEGAQAYVQDTETLFIETGTE